MFAVERDSRSLFNEMNEILLDLTESEYGFIGKILYRDNEPYLKTVAISNISWNKDTKKFYEDHAPKGLEFTNLKTLFGKVMTSGKPVISNSPYTDPRRGGLPEGHPKMNSFLGMPFSLDDELIGMVGIANRPGGYDDQIIQELEPFLSACTSLLEGFKLVELDKDRQVQLNQVVDQLESQVHKMNEFTYIMAHDVGKHSSNLKMLSDLLVSEQEESEKNNISQMVQKTSAHLSSTVNDINDIVNISKNNGTLLKSIHIKQLLDNILDSFKVNLDNYTVNVSVEDVIIKSEPAYINSIFENIISNAIKYTSNNSPEISILFKELDKEYLFKVSDNGSGIDLKKVGNELFGMFKAFHNRPDSRGLGLYITKKYVDALNGEIHFNSTVDKGTEVSVKIPKNE
jgi:signal transduction histidine kinase